MYSQDEVINLLLLSFSKQHMLDILVLKSILDVEVDETLTASERLVIRFEAHIFRSYLGNNALFDQYFTVGNPNWTGHYYRSEGMSKSVHENQDSEYEAFELAKSLNEDAAYNSISMGRGQIMGFNSKGVGYYSPKKMYDDFSDPRFGGINQVIAFIIFLSNQPFMLDHIRIRNWDAIARKYNGTANTLIYSERLKNRYDELRDINNKS